jgi:hypothetical protein
MLIKKEKVFVDMIDKEVCVLLVGEEGSHAELPLHALPEGTSEGDWLMMTFETIQEVEAAARKEIEELLNQTEKQEAQYK